MQATAMLIDSDIRGPAAYLVVNLQLVFHLRHAGGRPCGSRRIILFTPGMDETLQRHLVVFQFDVDVLRIEACLPLESFLDLLLDIGHLRARFDGDLVGNTDHSHQIPH